MAIVTDEIRAKVKDIVCDILELEPEEVTESSLFIEDFGADSMRAIEILSALEITFRTNINQADLERMVNLDGIYEVLEETLKVTA